MTHYLFFKLFLKTLPGLVLALFIFSNASSFANTNQSTIPTVKIGDVIWDQHEMTIGEVKRFAQKTQFKSVAEQKGGGLSYEVGFIKKPGWTWLTPYGVPAQDQEPAVHLNAIEAETICRFYGKRLPSDSEWTNAAYLEQRNNPPPAFTKGQRYLYPNGLSAKGSHCLSGECGNYKGLAPDGALTRGTGHVLVATTQAGINGLFDMGGNVWEWTATELNGQRITRGASWWYGADQQKEANLATKTNDLAVVYIGFRCVQ